MTQYIKNIFSRFICIIIISFFLVSCSSLPFIGKKKEEKNEKTPAGKTVSMGEKEQPKGTNVPKSETPSPKKPGTEVTSSSAKPGKPPSLLPSPSAYKRKVAILDFENNTLYKEEKIGEAVSKMFSDKLEESRRAIPLNKTSVSEMLSQEGFKFDQLANPSVMKHTYLSLGIQAFVLGTVTDLSLLSTKVSETSDEEVTAATAKVEIRLIDASTGNLLRTCIGRSPIFSVTEKGNNRGKAVQKAIELSLDDILEAFLHQLDLLDWTTTVAKSDGENVYLNAGKLSGIHEGDNFEIFEPGREIINPVTNLSLGWTTGKRMGTVSVSELFGVDASIAKTIQGNGFSSNDVVKPAR